jgi:branched-chain amino acid transport system substrate-binding protein
VDRISFLGSTVAMLLTPVTSTGQPFHSINPVTGLPAPATSAAASLTLAVVGPMSGLDAELGRQMANGARAAIDDANAQPLGSLDRRFLLVTFDDQDRPIQSALSASYAVNDGNVIGVVGHFTGVNTDAALHTYVSAHMPLVVPATTADMVTSHGYRNIFRLPTRDGVEGTLSARYLIRARHPRRCSVITPQEGYGSGVALTFTQEMRSAHVETLVCELGKDDDDLVAFTKKVLDASPDLVFFAGKVTDLGGAFDLVAQDGRRPLLAASQGFFSGESTSAHSRSAEGLIVATSIAPMTEIVSDKIILSDFSARYGAFTPIAGYAYAAMQVIIAATRRTGAGDRASLTSALSDGSTYQTIAGDFSFTPFGDQVDPNLYFYTVKGGAWKYLASYRPAPFPIKNDQ